MRIAYLFPRWFLFIYLTGVRFTEEFRTYFNLCLRFLSACLNLCFLCLNLWQSLKTYFKSAVNELDHWLCKNVVCDGLVDHAFGFQTVDVWSNPTNFLLTLFIYFLLVFIYLSFLHFVLFLLIFFIKHEILFTNFSHVEFECMFSFVSLLFISLIWHFSLSWRRICRVTLLPSYKPCENNDYIKEQ